ncbi:MAG: hypothetical protein ABSC55_23340 [Syntrophorhabdales bacterium]
MKAIFYDDLRGVVNALNKVEQESGCRMGWTPKAPESGWKGGE